MRYIDCEKIFEGMEAFASLFSETKHRLRTSWQLRGRTEARLHRDDWGSAAALASCIERNRLLQRLWLCLNDVTNDDVVALARGLRLNVSITKLDLSSNLISDAGAAALAEAIAANGSLRELHLSSNEISDQGAASLGKAIKEDNRSLQLLNLESNHIGDAGALALADALSTNDALAGLWLGMNRRMGLTGALALVDALEGNCTVTGLTFDRAIFERGGAAASGTINHEQRVQHLDALLKRNMGIRGDARRLFRVSARTFLSTFLFGVKLASPSLSSSQSRNPLGALDDDSLLRIADFAGVAYRGGISRWKAAKMLYHGRKLTAQAKMAQLQLELGREVGREPTASWF